MIHLNEKEKKFIELKSEGKNYQQIASELFLSYGYVENMASRIYEKTGATNGSSLIRWAFENDILKINKETSPNELGKTG